MLRRRWCTKWENKDSRLRGMHISVVCRRELEKKRAEEEAAAKAAEEARAAEEEARAAEEAQAAAEAAERAVAAAEVEASKHNAEASRQIPFDEPTEIDFGEAVNKHCMVEEQGPASSDSTEVDESWQGSVDVRVTESVAQVSCKDRELPSSTRFMFSSLYLIGSAVRLVIT